MNMLSKWATIFCVLATAYQAQAANGLRLGQPAYGGTGCPAGSASVSLSPGEDAISILFDNFVAEAGSTTGRRLDRKACAITVPVSVPSGYSVAVFQTDYRGFNLIPGSGAYTKLDTEYFWAGIRGPLFSRMYRGPQADNYTQSNGVIASALVWTPCGASVNLRVNSSILAMSNSRMDQTMMTVDSADITSDLIYQVQWRRCR
jgi:hypothetical protein